MKPSLVLFASLLLANFTASANEVVNCYERTYDAAQLRANPQQIVQYIRVSLVQEDSILYNSVLVKTAKPVNGVSLFSNGGACRKIGGSSFNPLLSCGLDADGGNYTLAVHESRVTLTVAGAILLTDSNATDDSMLDNTILLEAGRTNGVYSLRKVAASKCE